MHSLRGKLLCSVLPTFLLLFLYQILFTHGYLHNVRIEEIPFSLSDAAADVHQKDGRKMSGVEERVTGIHAISSLEQRRGFFHVFNIPYIVCFFAAKGKWPFIPPFMQPRVDEAARTFFHQNDSVIKQFCQKWIQIKECFRPIFGKGTPNPLNDVEQLGPVRSTPCTCSNEPIVYFDRDHIGNVGRDTILNTIEFLESFLEPQTPPTKKKKKNRVRSRLDEIEID